MNVSGFPAAGHNKLCYAAVSCLNACQPSLKYCLSFRKNPAGSQPELPARPDNENALFFQLLEKQDTASCCQLAGKNIQNLNAKNSIKARRPPTSTSTIRISMQASCFCYFRCANVPLGS
jgi:hypothetical protein